MFMDREEGHRRPVRTPNLIEVQADDDLLVYKSDSHQAFRLNASAAALWLRCDGMTPLKSIAPSDDRTASEAFARLVEDGLVEFDAVPATASGVSRRTFVKVGAAAVGGAIALPLIQSINAPGALAATLSSTCTVKFAPCKREDGTTGQCNGSLKCV